MSSTNQSNSIKKALLMLTLCGPLMFIGFMVPLFTPWTGISGVQDMFEDFQGNIITTCMSNHFIQITQGVCNRGTYADQDPKYCSYWTETSQWTLLDLKNSLLVSDGVEGAIFTDTVADSNRWYLLEIMVIACVVLSAINMMFFFFLTADWEVEHVPNEDLEYRVIQISGVLCAMILIMCSVITNFTFNDSDIANGKTWRTTDCEYTSTPTLGFFLFAFAFLCCLTSVFYSVLCVLSVNLMHRDRSLLGSDDKDSDSESNSDSEDEENGVKSDDDDGNDIRGAASAGTRTAASYLKGRSSNSPVNISSATNGGKVKTAAAFLKSPVQPLGNVTSTHEVGLELGPSGSASKLNQTLPVSGDVLNNSRPTSSSGNSKPSHIVPV